MDTSFELASETFARLGEREELKCNITDRIEMRCYDVMNKDERKLFDREMGRYITLELKDNLLADAKIKEEAIRAVAHNISKLIKKSHARRDNILVAGLGNPKMTADSLGVEAAKGVRVVLEGKGVRTITPSVYGETGVESFDVIKGVVAAITPDVVIIVDTLACRSVDKLYKTFQLSDAGIRPGAGLGNRRKALTENTLGVPVISIGVPLISYTEQYPYAGDLCVTPKEIDIVVKVAGEVIAQSINRAVYGKNA
ncbi:MAG: GPR endopeptidase [Clostridia bacterium]|nr:GPR endopeptidase [Clostridia bacterium]